jgi:translation initiation factor IF-2
MSKKRVHEIVKELKEQGIELDNKEIVTELTDLGYDVKSHSSSLEDDQAKAAVQRILDKRRPKQASAQPPAKGFMMVRRKAPAPAGASAEPLQTYAGSAAAAEQGALPAAEPPPAEAQAAPAPVSTPEPPSAAEPPALTASAPQPQPAASAEEAPAAPAAAAPVAEAPAAAATTAAAAPPAPPPVERAAAAPPAGAPSTPSARPGAAQPASNVQERVNLPQQPPRSAVPPSVRTPASSPGGGRPSPTGASTRPTGPSQQGGRPGGQGGRPPHQGGGRASGPQQGGRPPYQGGGRPGGPQQGGRPPYQGSGRPGGPPSRAPGQATGQGQQGGSQSVTMVGGVPHAPTQPGADPRTLRPTATQAVVISRPLVQVRRVTPTTSTARQYPMAPGKKAIGEVREFKVVPDHLGRGRELVDVSKSKDKEKRGKRSVSAQAQEGAISKQEISDLVWGRVTIPIRGKKKKPTKKGAKTQITQMAEEKKVIKLQEGISVSDLGQRMGVRTAELIKKLMGLGKMATANQIIDKETAEMLATDYGWRVEKVGFEVEDYLPEVEAKPEDERHRPPVVTVMGHVDHGKTSLLDALRKANVAAGEAGGITQHIGAYSVSTSRGDITFLDTPGHEAFTAMRARGANVTDIVVLVVAADDGVMPQTVEAIKHAKAAEVPIVVAINKMDVGGANPDRVKKDLASHELVPEEWGGDTIMVPVSAKQKMNLDLLLENIALQAEVLELTANPVRPAVGAIIEAKLEKGRGPVATVLVQEGTLRVGDAVVTGPHYGKVRAMVNSRGEAVKEVLAGYCAEVVGLSGVPSAGDMINVVADERAAKEIAEHRDMKERQAELSKVNNRESLEQLLARAKAGTAGPKELRVVLKADVQGSAEAVAEAVRKLSTHKVKVEVLHTGVGAMTETDVMLAAASKGLVVGFNVKPESGTEPAAKAQGVVLQTYDIIYDLVDGVRKAMEDLLEPIRTERKLGKAEVRNTFNVPKLGTIAGVAVVDGVMRRGAFIRLLRDSKQLYAGKMASLRRFKDDVKEVTQGFECGIGIENYSDLKPGDIIEAYEIEETRPSLS